MSAEGFEKTRVQNPDEAHEEANMLSASMEAGETPTAEDYEKALEYLNELQEEAGRESSLMNSATKPLRNALAGLVAVGGHAGEILGLAIVNIVPAHGRWNERDRQQFADAMERIGDSYELTKENLASAQERLEKWKSEAAEFAQKGNE